MIHQGKKVEEIRKMRGISKKELANRINRANSTIHDILNREEITYSLIEKLGIALDYDFRNDFFKKSNPNKVEEPETKYEIEDHIKQKYIMQGKNEQLQELLKGHLAKHVGEQIVENIEKQISTISNQIDAITQKHTELEEKYLDFKQENKKA